MAERKKPYDLRERLLLFWEKILEICKKLPKLTSQPGEKEVNPAFQSNSFEPIVIGFGFFKSLQNHPYDKGNF
jgi:hypothetical protein